MRVLLINYELPPIGAGAGNATAQIARYLASAGAEVGVLTSRFDGLPAHEFRDGYAIWRAPSVRRRPDRSSPPEMLSFVAGAMPLALRLGKRWRPDATCVFFGVPCGPLGLVLRRILGIPYIVSLRGGDVPGFMGRELAALHRATLPLLLTIWRQSNGLIANSPGLLALARRTWPDAPIRLIPNGVDLEIFSPGTRVRPADPPRLLYVGRLASQKGIIHLLEALRRTQVPVELRIVGDGPERPRLQAATLDSSPRARVEFAGWSERRDLPGHYRWADAFVLPSLDEGMPNVVLEAQASGLPIIGTDVAGTRDLVEHGRNGFLVPPAEPAALAAAIDSLAGDANLVRTFGACGRASAMRYSWAHVADQYGQLLQTAARRSSAHKPQHIAEWS
jgi:glycosyltransferase involved in cell wall biosynthesis